MTTGQKLVALRGFKSRRRVHIDTGITERTLIHLERDERQGRFDTLCKLADYYGVKVDDLRSDE